jgi:hypothetical protein
MGKDRGKIPKTYKDGQVEILIGPERIHREGGLNFNVNLYGATSPMGHRRPFQDRRKAIPAANCLLRGSRSEVFWAPSRGLWVLFRTRHRDRGLSAMGTDDPQNRCDGKYAMAAGDCSGLSIPLEHCCCVIRMSSRFPRDFAPVSSTLPISLPSPSRYLVWWYA